MTSSLAHGASGTRRAPRASTRRTRAVEGRPHDPPRVPARRGRGGLLDRDGLITRLARALAMPDGGRHVVAVIDLDGFKAINDRIGRQAGDALLAAVGERILGSLREGDAAARFGGDEYVLLLGRVAEPGVAQAIAERVLGAFGRPFAAGDQLVRVSASMGLSLSTAQHGWPTELLREADLALLRAKAAGGARAVLFDASMHGGSAERLGWEMELQRALDEGELRLHYQPEVELAGGGIVGAEALVRWQHPALGLLLPTEIIPLAEDTGLILPLGRWALEEACRQARRWEGRRPDGTPLTVSVNLSARQFRQADLVEQVAQALGASGLTPEALRLEITESVMIAQLDTAVRTLARLRDLGVRVALDDFGVGYSSLNYLRHFAVDALKIDRSFVREISQPRTAAIVQAMILLAHGLEMTVTGEGIESAEQLAALRALGCEYGQGAYFAGPLTPGQFAERLAAPRSAPPAPSGADASG